VNRSGRLHSGHVLRDAHKVHITLTSVVSKCVLLGTKQPGLGATTVLNSTFSAALWKATVQEQQQRQQQQQQHE
jgi:hypothetical protein